MLYPDFEELLQLGSRIGKLDLASRRPVLSIVSGDHRSPFRGRGLEFEEVREYVHGDDVRNIDWRVTARTGRPHLKLFSEERERSVLICTDVNHTMRFGTRGTFKSVQAAKAAALLGWAANRGNNRIGGSFFGNVPDGKMFFSPVRSRRSLWRMLKQLCDRGDYTDSYTPLEEHLRYLNKAVPSGSLVFIISDFLVISEHLKKRLSDLHRHADIVLVAINDPADAMLPAAGPVMFTDYTGQKVGINTLDTKGGQAYRHYWDENRRKLQTIIHSLGLSCVFLSTNQDVVLELGRAIKQMGHRGGRGHGRPALTAS